MDSRILARIDRTVSDDSGIKDFVGWMGRFETGRFWWVSGWALRGPRTHNNKYANNKSEDLPFCDCECSLFVGNPSPFLNALECTTGFLNFFVIQLFLFCFLSK